MPQPEIISGSITFAIHDIPSTRLALARWQEFKAWVEGHLGHAARKHGIRKTKVHRKKAHQ